jgi:hypothetical protein
MTMTMIDPTTLVGFVVFDGEGEKLGEIEGVYLGTEEPEWAALLMDDLFVIIPLSEATIYEDSIDIPFTVAEVQGAPWQQPELLEDLSEEQEDDLVAYYSGEFAGSTGVARAGAEVASTAKDQGQEVASTAKEQGYEVASTAKEQGFEVASTAKEQGQRVASTAKVQGQQVLQSTKAHAGEVVGTAKEQAAEVAQQASAQARNLLEETKSRVELETAEGAHKLGDNLSRLGAEAIALAEGRPQEAPTLQGYARRGGDALLDAADRAYGLSDDVRNRGIGALLDDVQTFARRRPGAFLLGTAVLGVMAGRAVRNAKEESGDGVDELAALPPARNGRATTRTSAARAGTRGVR